MHLISPSVMDDDRTQFTSGDADENQADYGRITNLEDTSTLSDPRKARLRTQKPETWEYYQTRMTQISNFVRFIILSTYPF